MLSQLRNAQTAAFKQQLLSDELAHYDDPVDTEEILDARDFMKELNMLNKQARLLKFSMQRAPGDGQVPLPDYVSIRINIDLKDIANNPKTATKLAYQKNLFMKLNYYSCIVHQKYINDVQVLQVCSGPGRKRERIEQNLKNAVMVLSTT